jgi:hypothetical protein
MNSRTLFTYLVATLFVILILGCASQSVTLGYHDQTVAAPFRGVRPVLNGSINNISGYFVIDTGAMGTTLSQTAMERCGISAFPSGDVAIGIGGKTTMMEATNVTILLAEDYMIHWQRIAVLPQMSSGPDATNDIFLGILGYQTFAVRHAVMDMKNKTITFTK